MPIHPALVHLPLGLAFVAPLVALALLIAWSRGKLPRRAFAVALGLQVLLLVGGLAASQSGEREEERVEGLISEAVIEQHEEAANTFLAGAGLAAVLGALALLLRKESAARTVAAGSVLASVVTAGLALYVGKLGGELVYRYGAASAYLEPGRAMPLGAQPAEAHHDDDD